MPESLHLNFKQLAAAMNRSRVFISAMKEAGYVMKFGTRDTLANAEAWLEAHPGFTTTGYMLRHRGRLGVRGGRQGTP